MVNLMHLVELRVDMENSVAPVAEKVFNEVHNLYLDKALCEMW